MQTFEVPVANLPIKLVLIPACSMIAGVVLWWVTPKFVQCLRVLPGREPRNPARERFT